MSKEIGQSVSTSQKEHQDNLLVLKINELQNKITFVVLIKKRMVS